MKFKVTRSQFDRLILIPLFFSIILSGYSISISMLALILVTLLTCYYLARIAAREVLKEHNEDKS